VVFFWLAVGFLVLGLYSIWRLWRESREERQALSFVLPAALVTAAAFAFIHWFFIVLVVLLDIPRRLRGQQITQQVFIDEFFASFRVPEALAAHETMLLVVAVALIVTLAFLRLVRTQRSSFYFVIGLSICAAFVTGALLLQLTLAEIDAAVLEAREAGESLPVWSQIILISAGAVLVGLAIWLWQRSVAAHNDRVFLLRALAAIFILISAYLLIGQLPLALAEAEEDVLRGFSVTVMFSLFSVPVQLALGLGLAVLLFQNIKAKSLFRVIYFLPYITPFVATSTIFGLIFSHRTSSPANSFLGILGIPPQTWLVQPTGIFQLIFGENIPDFLVGPGLALVVIILYNIWVYAGYSAVIFLAGLGNIPGELYEAARIDGASSWNQFRYITLPMLSPTTFFLILIATIGTFQAFTQIFLLRKAGAYEAVDTINIYIYQEIRSNNPDYAYGSAMAFVLFAVILTLTLLQNRVVGRRVFYG
jgi:multiple sugar transport system permease protein